MARPWFPEDAATIPLESSSSVSVRIRFMAPRNLNAPVFCIHSALTYTWQPRYASSALSLKSGVSSTNGAIRSLASWICFPVNSIAFSPFVSPPFIPRTAIIQFPFRGDPAERCSLCRSRNILFLLYSHYHRGPAVLSTWL